MISAVSPYLCAAIDPTHFNASSVLKLTVALCFERALQWFNPQSSKSTVAKYKYSLALICRTAQFFIAHRMVKQACPVVGIVRVQTLINTILYGSIYFACIQRQTKDSIPLQKPAIYVNRVLNGLVKVINVVAAVAIMRCYSNQRAVVAGVAVSLLALINLQKDGEELEASRRAISGMIFN
jgi:hypothetical protein